MHRKGLFILIFALTTTLALSWSAYGREVFLDTEALRVENIDGEQTMLFTTFEAVSEEYTLSGLSGKFTRSSNAMESTGTPEQPATLARTPTADDGQELYISASQSIRIHFDDERLLAEGDVTYRSEGTRSQSDLLMIDARDAVRSALNRAIDDMSEGEPRRMVLTFFEALEPDARLVLLQGNVRVEREDADLQAAWMLFDESNSDNFISVAQRNTPLQLRVILDDEGDEEDASDGEF